MDDEKLTRKEFFIASVKGVAIGTVLSEGINRYRDYDKNAKIEALLKASVISKFYDYPALIVKLSLILEGTAGDDGKLHDADSARAEAIRRMADELKKGPSTYLEVKKDLLNQHDMALRVPTENVVTWALEEGSFPELDRLLPNTRKLSPRFCIHATKLLLAHPGAQEADFEIYGRVMEKLEERLSGDDRAEMTRILADKARSLRLKMDRLNSGNNPGRSAEQKKEDKLNFTQVMNQMDALNRVADMHGMPAVFDMYKVKSGAAGLAR